MGSCLSTSKASAAVVVVNDKSKEGEGKYCYNDTNTLPIPTYKDSSQNGNSNRPSDMGSSSHHSGKSRHDNMLEWRDELGAEGDLAQAVVRIETSLTKRVEDIYDGIQDGPILGSGAAGIVRKCKHRETGLEFAVKCLNVGIIESDAIIDSLREEIFIMCQADHTDIIRLEEVYESDTQIYLILDLLTGGDVFDRLEEQPNYHYSEIQCAKIVKQMVNSIRYLHSKKVIHRDLKLENFLFDDEVSDNIRLIDFGLSKHFVQDGDKHNDAVGTPYTIAPETIKGEYDEKVDVWALGVITYLLLSGDPPFGGMDGEALMTIRQNILDCNLVFEPPEIWDNVSETAKNFIRKLLTEDPNDRPSAMEAQRLEWLQKQGSMDPEQSTPLPTKLVTNLLEFKDYSNLHKILLEVVSFTLLPGQIKELKSEFEKIDRDGRGEITLDDLKEVLLHRVTQNTRDSLIETTTTQTLTEEEVETIFDSLRLKKSHTTIRWHEFIAAGLSRADFDNRNLRLAFNRFDHDKKGYVTLEDITFLLRGNEGQIDTDIIEMWQDGMSWCKCDDQEKLYFADFQRVMAMKGGRQHHTRNNSKQRSSLAQMVVGLQQHGSVRRFSSRRLSSSTNNSTNSTSIHSMNDRMSTSRILSSTLAMRSASSSSAVPAPHDNDNSTTKSGEEEDTEITTKNTNQNWTRASLRSVARISDIGTTLPNNFDASSIGRNSTTRGSSRSSIGSAAMLTVSRHKQSSNLDPVAETTTTTTTTTTADC